MSPEYLSISKHCSQETLKILNHNVIGTPGKSMLYRHLDVDNKIAHIKDKSFVEVRLKSSIVGTCCFCSRVISNVSSEIQSSYIRYFSFLEGFRTASDQRSGSRPSKKSQLRKEVHDFLDNNNSSEATEEKHLFYAYLDPDNERSARLCHEFGFEKVREFTAIVFSRFYPKARVIAENISTSETKAIEKLLSAFYSKYNFFHFENTFYQNNYFVVKDLDGTILAGVHAHEEKWEILNMPGLSGKFIQHIIPKMPVLNRLFNKEFKFLSVEGVYYKNGHEKTLEYLIESLLHKFNLNKAMLFADIGSELFQDLKSLDLGLLDKVNNEVNASVIVKSNYLSAKEKKELSEYPAYISTFDLT